MLAQIIWSRGRPVELLTGHPVGFYWTSTRILQVCFKYFRIANFIEKYNKDFYWTSPGIYWASSRIALQDVH